MKIKFVSAFGSTIRNYPVFNLGKKLHQYWAVNILFLQHGQRI